MALLKKWKSYIIISVVLVVQALFLAWLFQGDSTVASVPGEQIARADAPRPPNLNVDEFELAADLNVNNVRDPALPMVVEFGVVAEIDSDNKYAFEETFEKKKNRILEAVATVARNATKDELEEPDLATFKHLIRESVGDVLGRDKAQHVEGIIIHPFKVYETQ